MGLGPRPRRRRGGRRAGRTGPGPHHRARGNRLGLREKARVEGLEPVEVGACEANPVALFKAGGANRVEIRLLRAQDEDVFIEARPRAGSLAVAPITLPRCSTPAPTWSPPPATRSCSRPGGGSKPGVLSRRLQGGRGPGGRRGARVAGGRRARRRHGRRDAPALVPEPAPRRGRGLWRRVHGSASGTRGARRPHRQTPPDRRRRAAAAPGRSPARSSPMPAAAPTASWKVTPPSPESLCELLRPRALAQGLPRSRPSSRPWPRSSARRWRSSSASGPPTSSWTRPTTRCSWTRGTGRSTRAEGGRRSAGSTSAASWTTS